MNEGINQNTNTADIAEPIQAAGGDAPASFDELDRATALEPPSLKSEPEPKAEKESKTEKDEKPAKDAEPKEPKIKPDKELKEGEKLDNKEKPVKLFKLKQGDSDIELRGDTEFEVMVNGKPEKVKAQDLLKEYSGKTDWSRKYSELDRERKTFHKDRDTIQTTLDKYGELAKSDPKAAMDYLGDMTGVDMHAFWGEVIKNLEPMISKRLEMNPEQRKLADLEAENAQFRGRQERLQQQQLQDRTHREMADHVKGLQQKHQLTDEGFYGLYKDLKESGEFDPKDLTPEMVVDYHQEIQARNELRGILKDINPSLSEPESAVSHMREIQEQNPEFTAQDLKDIAMEAFGTSAAKNLSRKLKKAEPKNTSKPTKAQQEDPWSFDHI